MSRIFRPPSFSPMHVCICMLAFFTCSIGNAALVNTTFSLVSPSAPTNELSLNLLDGATTTQLSGTFQATLDINQVTGVITSLELTGGSIVTTDWTMNVTGIGVVDGAGITATVDTPAPPSGVTGTAFNATENLVILNSGIVTAGGNPVQNFATEPLNIPGTGNGIITSTPNGGVFDISFNLPINSTQVIAGQNLLIVGNLVAEAQINAVPEPSSFCIWPVVLGGVTFARRRSS